FLEALKPMSALGPFSHRAQALRHRYIGFVEELFEEAAAGGGAHGVPAGRVRKKSHSLDWIGPQVFWVFYLGVLLFWLQDRSPRKQHTMAFLDRSLSIGVSVFKQAGR